MKEIKIHVCCDDMMVAALRGFVKFDFEVHAEHFRPVLARERDMMRFSFCPWCGIELCLSLVVDNGGKPE